MQIKNPIYQTVKNPILSEGYQFVPTMDIQAMLIDQGFSLNKEIITKSRKEEKKGFQKHMVLFDHPMLQTKEKTEKIQLLMINSHDGKNSLQLLLGIWRMVCGNGLISGNSWLSFFIRHNDRQFETLLKDSIGQLTAQTPKMIDWVERLKQIELTQDQINLYAQKMFLARMEGTEINKINLEKSLIPFRPEDSPNTAWAKFNLVQERVIKGGIVYEDKDHEENWTRRIQGIGKVYNLNRMCWDEIEKIAA